MNTTEMGGPTPPTNDGHQSSTSQEGADTGAKTTVPAAAGETSSSASNSGKNGQTKEDEVFVLHDGSRVSFGYAFWKPGFLTTAVVQETLGRIAADEQYTPKGDITKFQHAFLDLASELNSCLSASAEIEYLKDFVAAYRALAELLERELQASRRMAR